MSAGTREGDVTVAVFVVAQVLWLADNPCADLPCCPQPQLTSPVSLLAENPHTGITGSTSCITFRTSQRLTQRSIVSVS